MLKELLNLNNETSYSTYLSPPEIYVILYKEARHSEIQHIVRQGYRIYTHLAGGYFMGSPLPTTVRILNYVVKIDDTLYELYYNEDNTVTIERTDAYDDNCMEILW